MGSISQETLLTKEFEETPEIYLSGTHCDRCKSIFSEAGFRQILEPGPAFVHHDLATLKRSAGSCPFCRTILDTFRGGLKYLPFLPEEFVDVVLKIITKPRCDGLSQGSGSGWPMHVLSISLYSVEFAEVVRDVSSKLNIFASEDNPAASWILTRPPELNVTSAKTISRAKALISECQNHHDDCQAYSTPKLPTRVIDVHDSTSPTIHLHIPGESGEVGEYVTLSYCWGGEQPLLALKTNLDELQSGFELASLPQTLRDAVRTTRDLGYRYLWIDALCIVQDEKADRKREIGIMADIYRNSTVTILAATSESVSEGYLDHPREQPAFITVPVNLPSGELGQIHISTPSQYAHFGWQINPLSKRAWAFQECLLAKRILFYGPYEVLYHCQSLGFTRLSPSYIKYPDDEQPSSRTLFKSKDVAASWPELVRQYTLRSLRFPEDRPVAIAGITRTLEDHWKDKCVFGAWASLFLTHMTWYHIGFPLYPSSERSERAPSWSWLSIDGHVGHFCKSELKPACTITANLDEVAKGAGLTLNCAVLPEQQWPDLDSSLFTTYMDVDETDEAGGKPRSYLYLGSTSESDPFCEAIWTYAFVLIVVEEKMDVFRRIGLIRVHSLDFKVIADLELRTRSTRNISLI